MSDFGYPVNAYVHAMGTLLGSGVPVDWFPDSRGFVRTPASIVKNGVGDYTVELEVACAESHGYCLCLDHWPPGPPVPSLAFAYSRPDTKHVRVAVVDAATRAPVDADFDLVVFSHLGI